MQQRKLGRTGLDVGAIGLGTEYLLGASPETMASVVHHAVEAGANYVDLLYTYASFLADFSAALRGYREKLLIAVHLGGEEEGECSFGETLARLNTDHADIALLHMVDSEERLDTWGMEILGVARQYRQEGKVRFVGMSSHKAHVAAKAVTNGLIDVLMYPVNLAANLVPGNAELFALCARHGVGLVAMKPYAGGQLLRKEGSVFLRWVQSGGESLKVEKSATMTPVQCMSYVLSQPGVSTVVPGVKNAEELAEALAYFEATDEEKDCSALIAGVQSYPTGTCQYCNHCLPCPAEIDIAATIRLLDSAQQGLTEELRAAYSRLPAKALACTACQACLERCPFDVDIVARMQEAVALFES